jgi:chemotaxis-related protein WspD
VVNVHGELIVCIALASALELDVARGAANEITAAAHARLLMIRRGDIRAACPVDEVSGVHRVPPGELADAPGAVASAHACATKVWPWKGRCVGVLDDALVARAMTRSLA